MSHRCFLKPRFMIGSQLWLQRHKAQLLSESDALSGVAPWPPRHSETASLVQSFSPVWGYTFFFFFFFFILFNFWDKSLTWRIQATLMLIINQVLCLHVCLGSSRILQGTWMKPDLGSWLGLEPSVWLIEGFFFIIIIILGEIWLVCTSSQGIQVRAYICELFLTVA